MKFDVSSFLRAATQAAHGTIAGHIQGEQERQAEQQNQFQRDLQLFHTGNQLENQQDERDANYDQGVASVLPHLNPADRQAWTQTLLQRQSDRANRPRRFGAGQLPGGGDATGRAGDLPPAGTLPGRPDASFAGLAPSPALPVAPSAAPSPTPSLQLPASFNGVGAGPASPAGAAAAPAPQGGAPAAPAAPIQSPVQLAMMRTALGVMAPFVPGGGMMAGMLNQYHPPEVNAPAPVDAARMMNTIGRDLPGQPVVTAPVTSPVTSPATTSAAPVTPAAANPNAGALNIPGYPTAHMQMVDKAAVLQVNKDIDGDLKDLKDLQDADPATRQAVDAILRQRPADYNTPDDVRMGQEIHSRLRQMLIGSSRTVEQNREHTEKALDARATALPRDNGVAVGEILKLRDDYANHQSSYPKNNLKDYFSDPQMQQDIAEMKAARSTGDEDRAEEIAASIKGRLSAGLSPKEEDKRLGFVYKDIANLAPGDADTPRIIREIYAKNGLGYMVQDSPDEALRAGGWRAQKSRDSLLKTVSSPGFAKLTAASQGAALDALREANKETGGTLSIPASIALRPDPLITKKLALMDTQIDLNGTRGEVAQAHLKIDQARLALDQQRFKLAEKKLAQGAKGSGDKTWNRDALMHRDMWMDAEKKRANFLKGIKSTEADYSTFSPQEKATYNQLTKAAGDQKGAYVQFFTQHGVGVPEINAGGTAKPAAAAKPLTAADAAGMSTADLMERQAQKYRKK